MGLFSEFFHGFFGEDSLDASSSEYFDNAALADLLPYRAFDEEKQFFYNDKTTSFMFEVNPISGNGEAAVGNLHSALQASMPASGGFQVLSWSSPDIENGLGMWANHRVAGGEIVESMSSKRMDFLRDRARRDPHVARSMPFERRVFIVGWIDVEPTVSALGALGEYRSALISALGMPEDSSVKPTNLLHLLEEILQSEQFGRRSRSKYQSNQPLNAQIPGSCLSSFRDRLHFDSDGGWSAVASTVNSYPDSWEESLGHLLLGDPDVLADRPHGPVLSTLTALAIPGQKASADIIKKRAAMEHAKTTKAYRWISKFLEKEAEYKNLAEELERGERMFRTLFTVVAFVKGGPLEAKKAGSEMAKIYRRVGWNLRQERFLQLPVFMASLPMVCRESYMGKFEKLMRMRPMKGKVLSAVLPIHGEWKGNCGGLGMLLTGRQGQIYSWSPFISEGNYNVAVVGKSGAGKSVVMQELVSSVYANGGRALIIDDGNSFRNICEVLGGTHIAFDGQQDIRLNPFTMLQSDKMDNDEYRAEAVGLITRVVASMAALGEQREGRVADIEEEAISRGVIDVWNEKKSDGEITDVYNLLLERSAEDKRLVDVCRKLEAYTLDGIYGEYFKGSATVNVDSPFTVVELSDIKGQPGLEQVVLQIIMFLGTELMFKTDRSTPVVILLDEAWDFLKGEGTAKFIEGVVRRARKYTGALITGTQSVDDYYANPAAKVCFDNSDWTIVMSQKPEVIDRFAKEGRLAVPPGFAARLKSISSVRGQFSEMAFKGPEGWFFGRLNLDPFSLAAFSSKGDTVEALNRRKAAGMTTLEALNDIVDAGEVS